MLIAKISFYFESAKKTGEKFREKLGFQNHCPHPYHPPNRYQDTMKGLYAHLFIVAYRLTLYATQWLMSIRPPFHRGI